MLRIIAGIAGERSGIPGMATVADLATQAGALLEQLYQRVVHEDSPGIRGRIAIGETIWSAGEFAALRDAADAMSEVFENASQGLPATMRAAYLTQSRELTTLVDNVGNPDYAVWMERQGQETVLASTRTVLSSRIRACNSSAQFFLAGTSVCPAGDQRFLPETFGLGTSEPAAVVVETQGERPRVPTFVTLHLPKPNESGFEKNGSRLIAETMRRFPGKAMVVSNSLETLRRMQSFLAREPGLAEYSLLLPKNGHTRAQLLAQFAGQDRAILLIPFDYLSFGDIVPAKFLFVTKLQFPNSFLPTVARLKQALKERRGDAFRQFDLPYALTLLQYTLHQMDPRALRTVFMLDNRSFSSAYADRIRTVLPTPALFLPMENQESLLQHLDRWIRNQTL
jgi:Rad3-related DNA helicase